MNKNELFVLNFCEGDVVMINKYKLVNVALATAIVLPLGKPLAIRLVNQSIADINDYKVTYTDDYIYASYSDFSNDDIEEIPSYVTMINLNNCYNVSDLSLLPACCPNIEVLYLNNTFNLTDLSFIYQLDNLKEVYLSGNPYVTEELIDYLDNNDIYHSFMEYDLNISEQLDDIINSIITDDMNDFEKIKAVTMYVIENFEYDMSLINKSNVHPIECMLKEGRGVCTSYACLTNALLTRSGISSYVVMSKASRHAWNLLEIDNQYYYLDVTNMDAHFSFPLSYLFNNFDIHPYYLTNPIGNGLLFNDMIDYNNQIDGISNELFNDIECGESSKGVLERYGNNISAKMIFPYLIYSSIVIELSNIVKNHLREDVNLKKTKI